MSLLAWIVMGFIAGLLATLIVPSRGGWLMDIVLGIVGAAVGGFIFNAFGQPGVTGFNLYSVLVSVVGAVILLAVVRMAQGKRVA
jgi:uncharacterized membrane protein YeaQ/YmgE (transglycosylase-associated protein family)